MKTYNRLLALIICIVVLSSFAHSRSYRVNQIPNGNVFSCLNCHTSSSGGDRNQFGQEIENNYLSSGNVVWNNALATLDSDGDGNTNGEELQDPNSTWVSGTANPGDPSLVSNPGDINSVLAIKTLLNVPTDFNLQQNYPNPFNPTTNIQFSVSNDTQLKLTVYDLMGNEVKTIMNEYLPMGSYSSTWDGTNNIGINQSGGVYFYKLQSKDFTQIKKMTYIK